MSAETYPSAGFLAQNAQKEATVGPLAFVIAAGVCLCLRLYTKARYVKHVGASDAAISLSWITSAFLTATFWIECHYGMGRHVAVVPEQNYETILKLLWASILLYNLTLAFAKISILLQYVHIFASTSAKKLCWGFLILVSLHGFVATFLAIFGCLPVNFFWTKDAGGSGSCLNLVAILFFNASFNIATDIALVAIPLWIVRSLRMPRKQKWYLTLIFLLGGFGCITSILRIHSLYVSSVSLDFTWVEADTAVWSSAETNVGIMCACLATLKPLVAHYFPKSFLGSSAHDTSESTELGDFTDFVNSDYSHEVSEPLEKEKTNVTIDTEDLYHSFMKDITKSAV